jgi:hypothetical protein
VFPEGGAVGYQAWLEHYHHSGLTTAPPSTLSIVAERRRVQPDGCLTSSAIQAAYLYNFGAFQSLEEMNAVLLNVVGADGLMPNLDLINVMTWLVKSNHLAVTHHPAISPEDMDQEAAMFGTALYWTKMHQMLRMMWQQVFGTEDSHHAAFLKYEGRFLGEIWCLDVPFGL